MSLWRILGDYSGAFADGLMVTMRLCTVVWLVSFPAGTILGVAAASDRLAKYIVLSISALLSGVPAIVLLFWAYYPGQAILGVDIAPFATSCIALSLIGTFLVAQAVYRTVSDFPQQYVIAAKVCGLSRIETLRRIVAPVVLRAFVPPALVIVVNLFHMSFFAAFISVDELFRVTQRVNSVVYRPVEIYTAFALFCLFVSLPLFAIAALIRARNVDVTSER